MNIFNKIKVDVPKYNTFDLSYDHKLSMPMGKLIPFHVQECLPGDKFDLSSETLIRFAPLKAPVMHRINVYTHFFFVPNRILYKDWEKFITAREEVLPPYVQSNIGADGVHLVFPKGSVADYFGLPTEKIITEPINALPFIAYEKIYNDYYIDQNLDPSYEPDWQPRSSGRIPTPAISDIMPRNRAWKHDYFTSCLPWAQKGDAVNIPLSLTGQAEIEHLTGAGISVKKVLDGTDAANGNLKSQTSALEDSVGDQVYLNLDGYRVPLEDQELSGTINDLRRAFSVQKWLEKAARAGSRYVEQLLVHFNVRSSDKRLQRAEYIGGSKQNVIISEVLQTSESTDNSPQANMSGHGVSASSGNNNSFYCEEHGWILGIISVLPETAYQQGIPRQFSKLDPYDYYFPTFANIGEQEVLNKEIFYSDTDNENNEVFGYLPRYAEYRYNPSRVSGEFKDTLAFWHMGRIFDNRPSLNDEFIKANPTTRIFAVEDEEYDPLWCHIYVRNFAKRKIPYYGTPLGL